MARDVIMPALGMAQETGKVIRWFKSEGDAVDAGEPLVEIETDKVTVELESPTAGILAGIRAAEGDDVPVGETIAFVIAVGESVPERGAARAATSRCARWSSRPRQAWRSWCMPSTPTDRRVPA